MQTGHDRVLVVDDDSEVGEVIQDLLFDSDFDVCLAVGGQEALLVLARRECDVLLCHLRVLREDGGRLGLFCRTLQPRPRVVAMSASGSKATREEVAANLAKPFTRAQLLAALRPGAAPRNQPAARSRGVAP